MADFKPIGEVLKEVVQGVYPHCKESILCPYAPNPKSGYCFKHESIHGIKHTGNKKPINKVAEKRKAVNRNLAKIVAEMKKNIEICSIKSPVCNGLVQTANHIQKRLPNNIDDPNNLEPCCYPCNGFVENFPDWARENGHNKIR